MEISTEKLRALSERYGDAFYLLDSKQFEDNYQRLKRAFTKIYPHFNIAYSYKTNYIPKLCKIVDRCGGYAEVVSDMEMEIALRIGVKPEKIIWNGPVKNYEKARQLLIAGGTVNLDSMEEINEIKKIAAEYPEHSLNVGIRCNFNIGDGLISRFGFDVNQTEFIQAVDFIKTSKNIHLFMLQCHFADRKVQYWPVRAKEMLRLREQVFDRLGYFPEKVDLGGGIFGNLQESLKNQFPVHIPEYDEYAEAAAPLFSDSFPSAAPELLIEPGPALAGDSMKFAGRIKAIKSIRGKHFATILGSQKNINMSGVNPPITVYPIGKDRTYYTDIDLAGYTCIESDVLYRNYTGELGVGDFLVFSNCGSYSIVMKPPFILPDFPVVDISGGHIELIKRREQFDDLFHTYSF